ncbi:hypothetical protein [Mucilaginibacter antarcticus]|uniref:hypothetical protein n=1 Tax=Mucilaginibacter antarcticus TaxID=1855725 RepID=UPI00363B043A
MAARDKVNLYEFGKQYGFSVPADMMVNNLQDLSKAGEKLGYPLVVKGKYYEAYVNHTADVAQKSFHLLSAKWGLPVIAQQFIKGTEINIAGLGDGEETPLALSRCANCISPIKARPGQASQ